MIHLGDLSPLAGGKLLLDGVEEAFALCLGGFMDPLGEEGGAGQDVRFGVAGVGDEGGGLGREGGREGGRVGEWVAQGRMSASV